VVTDRLVRHHNSAFGDGAVDDTLKGAGLAIACFASLQLAGTLLCAYNGGLGATCSAFRAGCALVGVFVLFLIANAGFVHLNDAL